ncbi:DUF3726 domain-containing protein [Pelagivirga sediminicola]|uniref:DUF3726 domain-containing protein n=1 Tax=Pelagivirga sediminicola TaxID=2170575 RepID=A0A2T7G9L7_9RHOB|nr:DUF3726 domain-containing protein [Pelagivirga sediminicola]PVA11105.1 DUF3726 domain-containing protein [Pelagivirga sediminicola]
MTWSLGEIEGLARKAARGGGFDWGLAEEAGKAVRWLASLGLPGPEALDALLATYDRRPLGRMRPLDTAAPVWQAAGGMLCPIATGAALCDMAAEATLQAEITLAECAFPLLLLSFVAGAAEDADHALNVTWDGATFAFAADLRGTAPVPLAPAGRAVIRRGAAADLPLPTCQLRYDLDSATAARLGALAQRTYAPDTAASRLSGAGAGLRDND